METITHVATGKTICHSSTEANLGWDTVVKKIIGMNATEMGSHWHIKKKKKKKDKCSVSFMYDVIFG